MDPDSMWSRCICGKVWDIDMEPIPETCSGEPWQLGYASYDGNGIDWGAYINEDGSLYEGAE